MKYIGFTSKFYTLWEVSDWYKVYQKKFDDTCKRDYVYIQNLSFDFESAKQKLQSKNIPFQIDLTIKGHNSFVMNGEKGTDLQDWQFAGGEELGNDIRISNNINELVSCWNYSKHQRAEFAKQRLIELKYLTSYDGNYYTQEAIEKIEIEKKFEGHFYNDKERIKIKVKEINRYGFEGFYGWTSIIEYLTEDGNGLKYIGTSSPNNIDDFTEITATIKHTKYNNKPETHLQRIKC